MPPLPTDLRNHLERTVIAARDQSEKAAGAALVRLAVHQHEPYRSLSEEERDLRNRLRAEARRLGDSAERQNRDNPEPFLPLAAEVAYAQWNRMLFARFLAENGLLMHPSGVAVTLGECGELAADEGEPDAWMLAARYASLMLPGIFRQDDPSTQVRFDAAGRLALERLLNDLPSTVFTADDSLGWVYQFWQTKRKKEVNESGVKIGGADISPVTQLFTEDYMVQFLLHNALGAWWASRHRGEPLPTDLDYLRRNENGEPAAGPFSGWPERAADLRILDPCCGSGHFLVAAFELMCRFRIVEEGLTEAEAGDAVIRDNLFGLELDPRCTQIAAFALALAAWKSGGYRELPLPNIACSGLPVGENAYEFTHLADGDDGMEAMLRRLHRAFADAPDLGSLIDPIRITQEEGIFAIEWGKVGPLLEAALAKELPTDPAASIFGVTTIGVARAADYLTRHYNLVATNVPYLLRRKQGQVLSRHIELFHTDSKADLATAFIDRCLKFCTKGGTAAVVSPHNWLFLGSYKALRDRLLKTMKFNVLVRLGPGAFETISGEVVNVALLVVTNSVPLFESNFAGLDVTASRFVVDKANSARLEPLTLISQADQINNPDARISIGSEAPGLLLERYAVCLQGIVTGDNLRFNRNFWELPIVCGGWSFQQSTVVSTKLFGGRENIVWWENGSAPLARIQGMAALTKRGISISQMSALPTTLYEGDLFDVNAAALIPHDPANLLPVWAFCSSEQFNVAVRRIDRAIKVTNSTLVKVPFDLEHWRQVAADQYPDGLPEPYSEDPTQWLFHGQPARSTDPLHVTAARLLGYRWPQNETDELDRFAIADGIACLPAVAGEPPAAQRLRDLLAAAYGSDWTPATQERLLADVGFAGRQLDSWLREGFFAQHCRLFHNRPFLWHIWDGHKEGFSAIVNYHCLTRQNLERLTYTYVQSWIHTQRDADGRGVAGANGRLVAALALQEKLKLILDGEPPFDIYVRWKPLHQQSIGWEPDINDGVRLNIRPFVTARILRSKFSVNWNKDRGTNPDGTERLNDVHHSRAAKEAARIASPEV